MMIGQNDQQIPRALYNAMLHPLIPYAIRVRSGIRGKQLRAADRYLNSRNA
jgi:hypothetical protein